MNLLEKILVGGGVVLSSLLPMKALGQDIQEKKEKKGYGHIALSLTEFNAKEAREETGIIPGIIFGYSKEIYKEINGRITSGYYYRDKIGDRFKIFMFDVGPQIEWYPTFNGSKVLYFGAGFRYRSLTTTENEENTKENFNGIGFSINFGWDARISKKKDIYFYLETEYDRVKTDEELNIGFTKLNAGIKF